MRKIRKLYFFDKNKTEEMISFLNNCENDTYISRIMFNPFLPLHHLLIQGLKFLPEAYLLKDGKDVKGLIVVAPDNNPQNRMEIIKLLFEENAYEDAAELVQYVVSKYKAKGVFSFMVKVDNYLPELLKLFVTRCGFSQISYEKIWRINHTIEPNQVSNEKFRKFRNSDAASIAALYNEALLPHFRMLLGKNKNDFKERLCKGLSYYSEYKYVIEDCPSTNIIAYISLTTSDNENFVIDVIGSSWIELDMNNIIQFAYNEIKKRRKKFNLFIKTKKYIQNFEKYEERLMDNKYECIQNQIVLTNSSAKIIKEENSSQRFIALDQVYTGQIGVNACRKKSL